MHIIQNNPYRILGVPVNAKEREIQKQITKATRFAEVGKIVEFDTDFLFLGELNRDSNSITKASNNIEQPLNRILYSLFWFWNDNHIDEAAIESLKKQNFEKAIEIWTKVVKDGDVSHKNYSNLANLKTLLLGLSTNNGSLNKDYFTKSVSLSGKFLTNDSITAFCDNIGGEHFKISKDDLQEKYISSLYSMIKPYLNKPNGITTSEFLSAFKSFSKNAQNNISQKFTSDPIKRIEEEIESTSDLRDGNRLEAATYGSALYAKTKTDLAFLKKVLGQAELKYQMIANKLANEILQCSIDFFNEVRDVRDATEQDGKDALRICNYAKQIVCGGQTKTRIEEAHEFIDEWVGEAPERLKVEKISSDIEHVVTQINRAVKKLQDATVSSKMSFRSDASQLMTSTKQKLVNIKATLGQNDDTYKKMSSEVVQVVLALMVQYVNSTASILGVEYESINVMKSLATFDMDSDTRSRYSENKSTLEDMYNRSKSTTSSSSSSSGGCYVATMVYGDYNHPQVMVLREFRDNVLSHFYLGRKFIQFYYRYSPGWVERLKDYKTVNVAIKKILNQAIKILK